MVFLSKQTVIPILQDLQENEACFRNIWLTVKVVKEILYFIYGLSSKLTISNSVLVKSFNILSADSFENGCHERKLRWRVKNENGKRKWRERIVVCFTHMYEEPPFISSCPEDIQSTIEIIESMDIYNQFDSFIYRTQQKKLRNIDTEIAIIRQKYLPATYIAPIIPTNISYFSSKEAKNLFHPNKNETVKECLQRRINALQSAIKKWSIRDIVLYSDGDNFQTDEPMDRFTQTTIMKCLYLMNVYQEALDSMDDGQTFGQCVKLVIQNLAAQGIDFYKRKNTILKINRQFRQVERFPARCIVKGSNVLLFSHFPEAREMLVHWSKQNIEQLNCEMARTYVFNNIIPINGI